MWPCVSQSCSLSPKVLAVLFLSNQFPPSWRRSCGHLVACLFRGETFLVARDDVSVEHSCRDGLPRPSVGFVRRVGGRCRIGRSNGPPPFAGSQGKQKASPTKPKPPVGRIFGRRADNFHSPKPRNPKPTRHPERSEGSLLDRSKRDSSLRRLRSE